MLRYYRIKKYIGNEYLKFVVLLPFNLLLIKVQRFSPLQGDKGQDQVNVPPKMRISLFPLPC